MMQHLKIRNVVAATVVWLLGMGCSRRRKSPRLMLRG